MNRDILFNTFKFCDVDTKIIINNFVSKKFYDKKFNENICDEIINSFEHYNPFLEIKYAHRIKYILDKNFLTNDKIVDMFEVYFFELEQFYSTGKHLIISGTMLSNIIIKHTNYHCKNKYGIFNVVEFLFNCRENIMLYKNEQKYGLDYWENQKNKEKRSYILMFDDNFIDDVIIFKNSIREKIIAYFKNILLENIDIVDIFSFKEREKNYHLYNLIIGKYMHNYNSFSGIIRSILTKFFSEKIIIDTINYFTKFREIYGIHYSNTDAYIEDYYVILLEVIKSKKDFNYFEIFFNNLSEHGKNRLYFILQKYSIKCNQNYYCNEIDYIIEYYFPKNFLMTKQLKDRLYKTNSNYYLSIINKNFNFKLNDKDNSKINLKQSIQAKNYLYSKYHF